jgi:hypothetical protein
VGPHHDPHRRRARRGGRAQAAAGTGAPGARQRPAGGHAA